MEHPRSKITILIIFTTCCVAIGCLWFESVQRAQKLLEEGRQHEKGDLIIALDRYQQAMRSYAPWSPAPQIAKAQLERLIQQGESQGVAGRQLAIKALMRLRGSAWATEGWMAPFSKRRPIWDQQLAYLLAQQDHTEAKQRGESPPSIQELQNLHLKLLKHDPRPSIGWSLYLGFGLLMSLLSLFGCIWHGFDAQLSPRPALSKWILLLALSHALWISALAWIPG